MGTIRVGIIQRTVFKGGKKLFPVGLKYSNIGEKELLNYMLQNSQVGRATAVCAVEAFRAAFETFLLNGHTMSVPALGTFSLSCNCKRVQGEPPAKTDKEAYSKFVRSVSDNIYNFKVRYTPESDIRMGARSAKFQGIVQPE